LLKGLEISEVKYSELNYELRFDAEYVQKNNLKLLNILLKKSPVKIGDFAYVTDGIHTSIDYSEDSGINLISATSPRENYFDLSRQVFISKEAHAENPRTALQKDDLIISTIGTIGNCAVADESILPANSDRNAGIIRGINKYSPHFVSTFLISKYGRFQTLRESTGNVQLALFLYKIRDLLVPNLQKDFQLEIEKTVLKAHQLIAQSKITYARAESLLLEALGLTDFVPSLESVNVKSFKESFAATGRLDSEFYQPKYFQMLERIQKLKPKAIVPLEELLVSLTNGQTPLHHDLSLGEVSFLTAEHVQDFRINFDSSKRVLLEHHQTILSRTRVEVGDLLITIKGRVGNVAVVEHVPFETNINQDVGLMRLEPDIHPYYLAGYLNSLPGKLLVEQISTGQINPFLGLGNLKTIPIPIFETEQMNAWGEEIKRTIKEGESQRKRSEHLLETAKRAVEMAIEQDEQTALAWLTLQV
jgi:hypothetical protein